MVSVKLSLDAVARSKKVTMAEVIAQEYGTNDFRKTNSYLRSIW
jgi:hypothetical protein